MGKQLARGALWCIVPKIFSYRFFSSQPFLDSDHALSLWLGVSLHRMLSFKPLGFISAQAPAT
jgi:hypothetical protein